MQTEITFPNHTSNDLKRLNDVSNLPKFIYKANNTGSSQTSSCDINTLFQEIDRLQNIIVAQNAQIDALKSNDRKNTQMTISQNRNDSDSCDESMEFNESTHKRSHSTSSSGDEKGGLSLKKGKASKECEDTPEINPLPSSDDDGFITVTKSPRHKNPAQSGENPVELELSPKKSSKAKHYSDALKTEKAASSIPVPDKDKKSSNKYQGATKSVSDKGKCSASAGNPKSSTGRGGSRSRRDTADGSRSRSPRDRSNTGSQSEKNKTVIKPITFNT